MENNSEDESQHSTDEIVAFRTVSNQISPDFHTDLAFRSREMHNLHSLYIRYGDEVQRVDYFIICYCQYH